MVKYILTMFVFGTFLMASDYSQSETKPTPTITISDDDSEKLYKKGVVKEIKVVAEVVAD